MYILYGFCISLWHGQDPDIPLCPREDWGGGEGGWAEQRALSKGTRCLLSRHSGRTFQERGWWHYMAEIQNHQQIWVRGIWDFCERTDQAIGEQVPSWTCHWHWWGKEQPGRPEILLWRPAGPETGQILKHPISSASTETEQAPQQGCPLGWKRWGTNICSEVSPSLGTSWVLVLLVWREGGLLTLVISEEWLFIIHYKLKSVLTLILSVKT